ncbi:alpha/beta hydrolase, partial [Burkholderia pseudomallei]
MSWQSKVACWLLRRQFRPETLRPVIDPARARRLTKLRVRV